MLLQTKNLTKKYGQLTAVKEVSFSLQKGEVLGIIGPNGSGKTTLFGMILSLLRPSSGEIQVFGEKNIEKVKQRIGSTLDTSFYYPYLSGWDHLKMVAIMRGVPIKRLEALLKMVGLWGRHKDAVKKYSMGMKQRLAIAIALVNDPELVILDEPTNGLDPQGIIEVRKIISKINEEGKTVIIASHILGEIEKVCTRILMIQNGVIIEEVNLQATNELAYFEINSHQKDRLLQYLHASESIQKVEKTAEDNILIALPPDFATDDLMRSLAQQDLYVNHFVQKSADLERLFLKRE